MTPHINQGIISVLRGETFMKIIVSMMLLVLAEPVYADEFKNGMQAYKNNDFTTALKFFKPLAKKGDPMAQYQLGLMYGKGEGVPEDFKEAVKWSRLSAEQGYDKGQYNLGVHYSRGWGVPQDNIKALEWWTLAADQGNIYSQYDLAELYHYGHGISIDLVKAHKWFSIAGAINQKNKVAGKMSHQQIELAKKLKTEWNAKKMKK